MDNFNCILDHHCEDFANALDLLHCSKGQMPEITEGAQNDASLQPEQQISLDLQAGLQTAGAGSTHW